MACRPIDLMLADIEIVKRIVVEAGRRALAHCGQVRCEFKADQSLVTVADRENEQYIAAELRKYYPGYAFAGEEFGWHGPEDTPLWACDPIDGTTNYVFGLPHWCVSVGLLKDGVPELGAIYVPRLDELFWAVRGQGAYCNGMRLQTADRSVIHPEDTVCFTSNAAKTLNTEAMPGRLRGIGSIAIELAYTARGNLCAALGLYEGILDMTSALCICFEAGCVFEHLTGGPVDIQTLLMARSTDDHFVVAPPRMAGLLQKTLHRR